MSASYQNTSLLQLDFLILSNSFDQGDVFKTATTCPSPFSFGYFRSQETLGGMQYDHITLIKSLAKGFYTVFC